MPSACSQGCCIEPLHSIYRKQWAHAEDILMPEVREGWHMWWHPYGEAMLPEHVTVVHPSNLPWDNSNPDSQPIHEYLKQALIYNWLDQANMYHVLMETGNFIYATACKLLNACSHASSHYQILATVNILADNHKCPAWQFGSQTVGGPAS